MKRYDAVVVGSGPNGFAAAITIARAGGSVLLLEAEDEVGGGLRSAAITLPGFIHDLGSAVHPLAVASPFFRSLPLAQFGLDWVYSPAELAHVDGEGSATLLVRSVDETAEGLGPDASAYRKSFAPLAVHWDELSEFLLGPPLRIPRHPIAAARFGVQALRSGAGFAQATFRTERARALFAGLAAHSVLPLDTPFSASFGLVLGTLGHTVGWPVPRGGARSIARALEAYFLSLGGEVRTNTRVERLDALPPAKAILFDTSVPALLRIAGEALSRPYRARVGRFKAGPGIFKMDWALSGPIPWRDARAGHALTVHLGDTYESILRSEKDAAEGTANARPFLLLAQPSLFDPTRAPAGSHTAWAYCHVPHGTNADLTEVVEATIERAAPGFRGRILARVATDAEGLQRQDANLIGGDIGGGANVPAQIFGRPVFSPTPYRTSNEAILVCSASTPPGGGVHGMCGFHAAQAALKGPLRSLA